MMTNDVTQVVYVVAHENGDDMCGGLNLHGIYTSEDAAKARLDEVVWEGFVYPVPLNIPGWLGYGSTLYDRHAASDTPPPDPLDENDHRDRIDRNGNRWTYRNPGVMPWCVEWCHCVGAWDLRSIDRNSGPLRFEVVALDDEVL